MLDPLTLDQLRILVTVAETGSFSAAARKLGRVQSAISQSVQSLETALRTLLFERGGKVPRLNDAGRILLEDARRLVRDVDALKARADSIADNVEPELALAVDALFPNEVLVASLRALAAVYPSLPVTVFTEGVGGSEQRLREGVARLGILTPLQALADAWETEFLVRIPLVPVVAAGHPLAAGRGPLSCKALQPHIQLVLTDRAPAGGNGRTAVSPRTWRFADRGTKLEFLLAGFGWTSMPLPVARRYVEAGRLAILDIPEIADAGSELHIVHERGRPPGKAGRWLVEDLRQRVRKCAGKHALPGREAA